MPLELADDFPVPEIPNKNVLVFGATGNEVLISMDINCSNSTFMLSPLRHLCLCFGVDDFQPAGFLPKQQPLPPLDTAYVSLYEFLRLVFPFGPNVSGIVEHNRDVVVCSPVEQIRVEVILEFGGTDHFQGFRSYFSHLLLITWAYALIIEHISLSIYFRLILVFIFFLLISFLSPNSARIRQNFLVLDVGVEEGGVEG